MTIEAKVVADSISPAGKRITSLQVKFPRFILPEFNTHRAFSRSFSSSRAIPIERLIQDVLDDPAMPVYWGKNKPGMQATEELEGLELTVAQGTWLSLLDEVVEAVRRVHRAGLHKQTANRLLEPFAHANGIVTSTEWDNFFHLRDHPDAQPEIRALAVAMKEAMADSRPEFIDYYQWHLPYVRTEEKETYGSKLCLQISTARCARVSYNKHDGTAPDVEEDLHLYERLVGSEPLHASPAEHQAQPYHLGPYRGQNTANFVGWVQYRKIVEKEVYSGS